MQHFRGSGFGGQKDPVPDLDRCDHLRFEEFFYVVIIVWVKKEEFLDQQAIVHRNLELTAVFVKDVSILKTFQQKLCTVYLSNKAGSIRQKSRIRFITSLLSGF